MTVKQISVFLENKPGQLTEFTKLLNSHQIDMRALSIADAQDFGVLRLIVDDSYKAACVLKEAGYVVSITPVLAAEISDKPGSLIEVLDTLQQSGLNLEYIYAFTTRRKDKAYMIFRVADVDKAVKALNQKGIRLICQSEMANLFGE